MKVSVAVDRTGVPVGVLTAAANVADAHLAADTLGAIPEGVEPAAGTPVIADKGYDSDPLREELAAEGYRLIAPHRKNRTRPATNDGRRLRRYKRRYIVERSNSWLHSFRRAITRFEYYSYLFDGFVYLACAFIAVGRL
jgi:IS5 family transposase